jgi:hypothetical protein
MPLVRNINQFWEKKRKNSHHLHTCLHPFLTETEVVSEFLAVTNSIVVTILVIMYFLT